MLEDNTSLQDKVASRLDNDMMIVFSAEKYRLPIPTTLEDLEIK